MRKVVIEKRFQNSETTDFMSVEFQFQPTILARAEFDWRRVDIKRERNNSRLWSTRRQSKLKESEGDTS